MGSVGRENWASSLVLLVLVSLLSPALVESSVHEYVRGQFESSRNGFLFYGGSEGMRSALSTSKEIGKGGIANGRSYIRFDSVTFRRTGGIEPKSGLVQAVVFEEGDRDKVGGASDSGHSALCCTPELAKLESCTEGQVIRRPSADNPEWPYLISTHFEGVELETTMPLDILNITKTGMYNLYFVVCDPQLKGLLINGRTVWKNPTGYLPGRMAPLMTFYGAMSFAYLLLGLAWFLQYMRFWQDTFHLHMCITMVIALGMFEMSLWYFEYANFNSTGRRPMGITMWAVTFGAVKKTVSRLLILAVSMGYGVVKPTLGGLTTKVLLLGATYFIASEVLDVVEHVGSINDLSGKERLFLVLPVAFLDAFFIVWIFTSLSKTLEKLEARRRSDKLELYRKFTNSLVIAVLVSVAWIGHELYFKATDPFSQRWQSAWIISAFWTALSFVLLCVVCFLWLPSHNSIRYAYCKETEDEFDDEETAALKSNVSIEMEKPSIKQEKKDRKPIDAFSLEDPEEDKRE